MSDDDDIRAVFRRIDDGPPLGIDAREVMADGRRVRALRTRLTIVGSALTAAAAAAVVALSVGGAPPPDMNRPARPPTSTPSTTNTTNTTVPVPQTTPRTTPVAPPGLDNTTPGAEAPANGPEAPPLGTSPDSGPPVATTS